MSVTRRKSNSNAEALPFAGLKFAVYARKSSEDDRNEDNRSTGRQVAQATAWVERKGGEVLRDHVYADDAVSGAEFRARPGLLQFLEALKNGKQFNALVMSEQSRLGREQLETGYLLKQIRDAEVRVFFYLTDDEAKLDSALEKMVTQLASFAAEMEREKARQRSRDAAERKARQGHVAGGQCFGYKNVAIKDGKEVPEGAPRDYVTRRIDEDEAKVIRGIFKAYADGVGMVKIAKVLNMAQGHADLNRQYFGGQKIAPPRGQASGWSPTLIREMLHRRLYRGETVWGRVTHTDRNGKAGVLVKRDEKEWVTREMPELRIIQEQLWAAVQARLKAQQGIYLRDCRGKLWGKPDLRKEGRYLLSGLAQCGRCEGRINVLGGVPRRYGCTEAHWKGVCDNRLTQRVETVDSAFLNCLEQEVLTPERFRYAVECGVERVREQLAREPDRIPALEQEKTGLTRKIGHMVAAIGDGKGPAALVREIEKVEARVQDIDAELARMTAVPALDALSLSQIEKAVAAHVGRFQALIKGDIPLARQALKKLLVNRIVFTPVELTGARRTYAFQGELSFGAVIRELTISVKKPRRVW